MTDYHGLSIMDQNKNFHTFDILQQQRVAWLKLLAELILNRQPPANPKTPSFKWLLSRQSVDRVCKLIGSVFKHQTFPHALFEGNMQALAQSSCSLHAADQESSDLQNLQGFFNTGAINQVYTVNCGASAAEQFSQYRTDHQLVGNS